MKLLRSRAFHIVLLVLLLLAVPLTNLLISERNEAIPFSSLGIAYYDLAVGWVCLVMLVSAIVSLRNANDRSLYFLLLPWLVGVCALLDAASYAVDRIPRLYWANVTVNLCGYLGSPLIVFTFWLYLMAGKDINRGNTSAAMAVSVAACVTDIIFLLMNLPFGYIFTISPAGVYRRADTMYLSYVYPLIQMLICFWAVWRSPEIKVREKLVICLFPVAPFIAGSLEILTGRPFSLYLTMLIGLLLIYSFTYTKRGKALDRDTLTGVGSVTAFNRKISDTDLRLQQGEQVAFAIVQFDINCLKQVNDLLGHDAGDAYIRRCCMDICKRFAHSPVYRTGGDEFVAFLEGEDYANRREILKGMDAMIAEQRNVPLESRIFYAYGLAEYTPVRGGNVRTVLNYADKLMYIRKAEQKAAARVSEAKTKEAPAAE